MQGDATQAMLLCIVEERQQGFRPQAFASRTAAESL
jgi:hypothetical protein